MSRETQAIRGGNASLTETIVTAVSDADDRDPGELPPLWTAIEPDALEAVFAPTQRGAARAGRVRFEYAGYAVTVDVCEGHEEVVTVEPAD